MTATPARPHDFGAWAPTITDRRLGDVARPSGGRARRQVLFAVVPTVWLDGGSRRLSQLLADIAGPTRYSPVVVQAFFRDDEVDQALADPLLAGVPVARLTRTRRTWDAVSGGGFVLLIAHCRVLWAQTATRAGLS